MGKESAELIWYRLLMIPLYSVDWSLRAQTWRETEQGLNYTNCQGVVEIKGSPSQGKVCVPVMAIMVCMGVGGERGPLPGLPEVSVTAFASPPPG